MPFLTIFQRSNAHAFLAWGLLFVFLFKAIIPIGYMPDLAALQKGLVRITICKGYGSDTVLVDKSGLPADKSQVPLQYGKAQSDFCPFGWTPQAALLTQAAQILATLFIVPEKIMVIQGVVRESTRFPAQPRAPPSL